MSSSKILVVDDEEDILELLRFNLSNEGFQVSCAASGEEALEKVKTEVPALILLDLMLPGIDGLEVASRIRSQASTKEIPIVMLTAKGEETDIVKGLEIGADDYITKPFSSDILLAHLRAVLRRATQPVSGGDQPSDKAITSGPFKLNPVSHTARKNDKLLDLAPREFDLLHMFLSHPERAFTSDELVEGVWGVEFVGEPQVLYVQVRSLRMKIEDDPSDPKHILTLRGVGYKFVP